MPVDLTKRSVSNPIYLCSLIDYELGLISDNSYSIDSIDIEKKMIHIKERIHNKKKLYKIDKTNKKKYCYKIQNKNVLVSEQEEIICKFSIRQAIISLDETFFEYYLKQLELGEFKIIGDKE